jgi:pimeloyl-ACP methyl ester carboxylesterase
VRATRGRVLTATQKLSWCPRRYFVDGIEDFRVEIGAEKLVLLGHSLGGYLCTAYSERHPDRVEQLILTVGVHVVSTMGVKLALLCARGLHNGCEVGAFVRTWTPQWA